MNQRLAFLAFAMLILFEVPSFAVLGRWIDPEQNRPQNAVEGVVFLQEIGALKPLTFNIVSTDRVDVAAGKKTEIKAVAKIHIEDIGNGNLKVVSVDPTMPGGDKTVAYQVESFSQEKGIVVLGERTPAYDSRNLIYISLYSLDGGDSIKIRLQRNIEQRGYESEFIPTKISPIRSEPNTIAVVQNLLKNAFRKEPIREKKIQSGNRSAEILRDGSILLMDSETKRSIRQIEPLGFELDTFLEPDFYFNGLDLIIEYKDVGQRLIFSGQDGNYLKIEPLGNSIAPGNSKIMNCESVFAR